MQAFMQSIRELLVVRVLVPRY
eukprot:COSAG03_NODE_16616_length_396_cov_1.185185_1_plen_21_part_01